jgi:hypothetical protein
VRICEVFGAVLGSPEKKGAFASVACQGGSAFELGAGFVEAANLGEEVAAYARQEMIGLQGRFGGQ